jgi:two-component system, chemotaxis family, CheB/CheR fusion protein
VGKSAPVTPAAKIGKVRLPKGKRSVPAENPRSEERLFPIVGIGASAGGLEALDVFLRNVPAKSEIAFIIVQHLEPTQKDFMVELLQRSTAMKVVQVKDRTVVRPACVYVIPPNKEMSILHGVLHLLDRIAPHGVHLPIDFFLRSLADDEKERSVGVILSGMGSDGTFGLRAIKEKGGATFVQDPASSKFDGMPKSAIAGGTADIVAPVEMLPGKIIAYLQRAPLVSKSGLVKADKARSGLEKILILLRDQTGHDFSLYKNIAVYRRIERRMSIHQIDKIATYIRFLQENPQELGLLFKELLIGVTGFFRDSGAWEKLKTEVIPMLLADRAQSQVLRAWVIGCATGEEAYSLAIVFKEAVEKLEPARNIALQIFATDLDGDAIEKARTAVFPPNISADVSPERLSKFFIQIEHGYRVSKAIREMVIFAPQNLIMDPPFTRIDILSCRNLLIYLSPELQKGLLPLFHYSLNPHGILFLGKSETVGEFTELFAMLDDKARLYQRTDSPLRTKPIKFSSAIVPSLHAPEPTAETKPGFNLQTLADQLLLQKYSPAAVLVNEQGDILYISGRTGKYLEPAAGKVNWNIFAMAREGLRYELDSAFQKALQQKDAVVRRNVDVRTNGGTLAVDITVQAIAEPSALRGSVMIVFSDVATIRELRGSGKATRSTSEMLAQMERELEQARQEARITRDEMQTFQEEARCANEEMQSMNEELQSTNEELQMLNHELSAKVSDLSRLNNDMKNLLDGTELTTLFLDNGLKVRLFTTGSNRIFKLMRGDVGRPITDIASDLDFPGLADQAREVLRTLLSHEQQVATRDGRWFMMRIMPYRTLENMIDGVVMTFVDITVSKTLEAELRKTQADLYQQIGEQSPKSDRHGSPGIEAKATLRSPEKAGPPKR